jgi:polysaccharide biosynthesis transport protein
MQKTRPTGADQALATVPGKDPEQEPSYVSRGTGSSPFEALKDHPLVAVLTFVVILAVGVPLIIRIGKPVYYANSIVYVSPAVPHTLKESAEMMPQYDYFVQQQMLMIPRYDIASKTMGKLLAMGIDLRQPGEDERRATERFIKKLEVSHVPGSYQISIGLHSTSAQDVSDILNTLTQTFIDSSRSEAFYGEDHQIDSLQSERSRLKSELEESLKARTDIARELGVVNFEQLPAESVLLQTRGRLEEARRARMQAEVEVTLLERDASLMALADPPVQADPIDRAKIERLETRRSVVEAAIADLKPSHPDYRSAAQEIARIDESLNALKQQTPRDSESKRLDQPSSQLLAKARIELERARRLETELNSELQANTAKVEDATGEFQRGRDLGIRVDQLRSQLSAIEDRLSYFRIEASNPGFLRVLSPARTPVVPDRSGLKKSLAALAGLSLCMSFLFAFLADRLRSSIVVVRDVEKILGFPPLGVLLAREAGTQYFAQEQFNRMVNNVERAYRQSGARVFAFTPAGTRSSDGRLIRSIANELKARGISNVVLGATALRQSTQAETQMVPVAHERGYGRLATADRRHSTISNLGYIESGQPENPRGPSLGAFKTAIESMADEQELILVDAQPIVLSADTEYLAAVAEVTILTIEAGQVTKDDLKRAASLLEKLHPAGVAAILHNVSLKSRDPQLRHRFREYEACRNRS